MKHENRAIDPQARRHWRSSSLFCFAFVAALGLLSCSSGGGGSTGGNGTPGPGTPTVASDGFLPTGIVIDGAYVVEGDSATQEVQLHVRLTKTYAAAVTVDWETADGSAIAGQDYLVSSGSLTYTPGETDKVITLTVIGDLINEPTAMEAFKLVLSNAIGAPLGTAAAFVSIEDDDRTVVGLDGGILRLAGGMVQLHALAGALASDTALTAAGTADADPLFVGSAYLISSPAATIFTGHVELSITYDPADITALGGGLTEGDLVIGQWTGGALQSISGSWTDTTAKTVSVSIEGMGTYVVMDGRNKRTNIAYVVNTPVLPNEFLTVPEAVTYVCLSGQGRVVIKRSPVTIGSFTPGCDVTLEPEEGTPVTVSGATTISSASPMAFTGFAFSGAVSFIAGDDLLLRGNQFASTVSVLLDATPAVLSGKVFSGIMAAPAVGCSHGGNVQYRENAAAGPLSVAVAAGTSYCGKTTVSDAILPTFVATASGNANLTGEARLELNRLGVQDVTVTANVEGNARVFLGSVDTGKIAANLNIPAGISGPRLDSLKVNASTSVDVGLDGGGTLKLSHKGLSVREGYSFSLLDDAFQGEVYGDVSAASVGKLKAEVGGKARWNLASGVAVQGSATYGVEAGLVDGVVANSDVSYQAGVHIDGTKLPLSVPFDLSFAGGSSSDVRGTVAVFGIGGSFKPRMKGVARAPMTAPAVPAGLNIDGFTIMPAGVTGPLENGVHIDADDRTDPIEVKNNIYRVGLANAVVIQNTKGTVLIQDNTIEEANYGIALEKVSTPVTIDHNMITASFGIVAGNDVQQVTATNNTITADMMGIYLTGTSSSGLRRVTVTGNTVTMPGEEEGALVLMSSTVLNFSSNIVSGSVLLTAVGHAAYATVVGNTIEPGHLVDNPFAPTLTTDPAGQSLDPEMEIHTMVDWSGNICADYPPSLDLRQDDPAPTHDGPGACIGENGVSPPVAPI